MQDGGWGWWSQSAKQSVISPLTWCYGLIQARDAGFDVRERCAERGEEFSERQAQRERARLQVTRPTRRRGSLFVLAEDEQAPTETINSSVR